MSLFKKYLILFVSLVLITNLNAQVRLDKIIKSGEIKVGITGTQPPFSMRAKSGELVGFDVELAQLLASSMNIKLKLVEMPFHKLMNALEDGLIDVIMSGMTITPERNLRAAFVGPYIISGKSLLTKSSVLAASEEENDFDKTEIKLAALKGSTSEKFVNNYIESAEVSLVANYKEGIDLLTTDKVDAMIADYPICVLTVLTNPSAGLLTLDEPLTLEPIGIALPPNDPLLTNLVQNYFNSIVLAGILDEMELFWFENSSWVNEVETIQIQSTP